MIAQIITNVEGGYYSSSDLNKKKSLKEIDLINDAIYFCSEYIKHVYDFQIKEIYISSLSITIELKENSFKNIFSKKITFKDIYKDLRKFIKKISPKRVIFDSTIPEYSLKYYTKYLDTNKTEVISLAKKYYSVELTGED